MTASADTDRTRTREIAPRSPTLDEHRAFAAMYKRIHERKPGCSSAPPAEAKALWRFIQTDSIESLVPAVQVRSPRRMLDWSARLPPPPLPSREK